MGSFLFEDMEETKKLFSLTQKTEQKRRCTYSNTYSMLHLEPLRHDPEPDTIQNPVTTGQCDPSGTPPT